MILRSPEIKEILELRKQDNGVRQHAIYLFENTNKVA